MDLGISGRTALVTGASTGLGLACARALAAEGVRVALASRSVEKLAAAAATIEGDPVVLTVDLSEPASIDALVDDATAALGQVDILVANGGGLICCAACLVVVWAAGNAMFDNLARGSFDMRSFDMPKWLLYAPFPLSFVMMAGEFLHFLLGRESLYAEAPEGEGCV